MSISEKGKQYLKTYFGIDYDELPDGPACEDLDLTQFLFPMDEVRKSRKNSNTEIA